MQCLSSCVLLNCTHFKVAMIFLWSDYGVKVSLKQSWAICDYGLRIVGGKAVFRQMKEPIWLK